MKNEFFIVSVDDTIKYGIIKAAIISRIRFWGDHNKENKVKDKFHDGEWWAGFFTPASLQEQLGIPETTIKRNLIELVKQNILIKGKFNKKGFDKTNWYRYNHSIGEVQSIVPERSNDCIGEVQSIVPERSNGLDTTGTTNTCKSSVNQKINQTVGQSINPPVNPIVVKNLKESLNKLKLPEEIVEFFFLYMEGATTKSQKNKLLVYKSKIEKVPALAEVIKNLN